MLGPNKKPPLASAGGVFFVCSSGGFRCGATCTLTDA
nr:MAG TPA: hypothetical protein [Caudoviricetes sp.]